MNQLISLLPFSLFFFVKIGVLILLFMYFTFAFIVYRQTALMTKVVIQEDGAVLLQIATLIHLLLSIFLFIFAVLFL